MTQAQATLERARAAGLVLILDGDEVRFQLPPGGMPRIVIEQLCAHKSDIRSILTAERNSADDLLAYALVTIQAIANRHPEAAALMRTSGGA
jgi:hypothetical protein